LNSSKLTAIFYAAAEVFIVISKLLLIFCELLPTMTWHYISRPFVELSITVFTDQHRLLVALFAGKVVFFYNILCYKQCKMLKNMLHVMQTVRKISSVVSYLMNNHHLHSEVPFGE
jgi:hypothetical protein